MAADDQAPAKADGFSAPELFHYTTIEGFCGILDSNCMWATHWQALNDAQELQAIHSVLEARLLIRMEEALAKVSAANAEAGKQISKLGSLSQAARHESSALVKALYSATFGKSALADPYMISFCAHDPESYTGKNGLLSQWRAYAQGGVAIVFDTSRIKSALAREQKRFAHPVNFIGDVVYANDGPGLDKNFAPIFKGLIERIPALYARRGPDFGALVEPFISASALVKHEAFHEESEARIVVSLRHEGGLYHRKELDHLLRKRVKYRARGQHEVAYIEFFDFDRSDRYPIKRIIIGPSSLQRRNLQIVRERIGRANVDVIMSATPYIP